MQDARLGQAEQVLQENLPGGGAEEIGAAHHVGYSLRGIVHHHGQLVGELPIGALQDEIADFACEILVQKSLEAVGEFD